MGLGLGAALSHWPVALGGIRWGGILFLCYMAWLLMMDSGEIEREGGTPPAFLYGALMQWLNPKAWLAASMGMGAYGAVGDVGQIANERGFPDPRLATDDHDLDTGVLSQNKGQCPHELVVAPKRLQISSHISDDFVTWREGE